MKLSIIIPVYNKKIYLRQCLESVLNQGLDEFEIIAVDDGSTDGSEKILDEYAAHNACIKVIRQQNQGTGMARNTGLSAATGDYVYFLDADDFLREGNLAPALEFAFQNNADVVELNWDHYSDQTGEIITPHELFYTDRPPAGKIFSWRDDPEFFLLKVRVSACSKLYRRTLLTKSGVRFQPIKNCEDYAYSLSHMLLAERIAISDIRLLLYRVGTGISMEDTLDSAPLCRIAATQALDDFAVSLPFYDQIKRGVCSMNAIMNTSFLTTCKSADAFREYYAALKNGALERLELVGLPRGYIVSPAAEFALRHILHKNPIMPENARHLTLWKAMTFPSAYAHAVFGALKTGGPKEAIRRIHTAKSRI